MQNFDFNVTRERRPGSEKGKTLRLIILFCIVAAVTALVIWLILPGGDKVETPVEENKEAADGNGNADADNKTDAGDSGKKDASADNTDGKGTSADSSADAADGKKNDAADNKKNDAADGKKTPDNGNSKNAKFDPSIRELITKTRELPKSLTSGSWKKAKFAVSHTVVPGDNLSSLCARHRNTLEFVQQFNNIKNANNISLGQKITFIKADQWQVTIFRKAGCLKIDRIVGKEVIPFAAFECKTRENGVTRSDLVISSRNKNPKSKDQYGKEIANPYGEFRITLASKKRPDKPYMHFSIHGRGDEKAVAASVRDGATVLSHEDILLLYYLVPDGTPVKIVE